MENVFSFSAQPKVFNSIFLLRLAEVNHAIRQLRQLGCRVIQQKIDTSNTELVIDRNPHKTLIGCPRVRVTCRHNSSFLTQE